MPELVLPVSDLKCNSATNPLAFKPMPYACSVFLFIFAAFPAKHQMPTGKTVLRNTLTSHWLSFLFFNHTVHKNNLAESLHVWE